MFIGEALSNLINLVKLDLDLDNNNISDVGRWIKQKADGKRYTIGQKGLA